MKPRRAGEPFGAGRTLTDRLHFLRPLGSHSPVATTGTLPALVKVHPSLFEPFFAALRVRDQWSRGERLCSRRGAAWANIYAPELLLMTDAGDTLF
jgi:hypothetical protein